MLKSSSLCLYSSNLGTFLLKIEQFWPFEEISIFINSGHLEWRAGLSDTSLKGTHTGTIPARFGLIWFSGFREDLNAILYQNMPSLHNRYISAERKISQKNIYVNDSQNLAFPTSHFVIELLPQGGMKFKKKSSPLKLLSQSQPNFTEMILVWSPFKMVYVSTVLYPRWLP